MSHWKTEYLSKIKGRRSHVVSVGCNHGSRICETGYPPDKICGKQFFEHIYSKCWKIFKPYLHTQSLWKTIKVLP